MTAHASICNACNTASIANRGELDRVRNKLNKNCESDDARPYLKPHATMCVCLCVCMHACMYVFMRVPMSGCCRSQKGRGGAFVP